MRIEIYVRPRASHTAVGGTYDNALVVRVHEPALDGRATKAALDAVASALGLRPGALRLVSGATARRKLIEVDMPPAEADALVALITRLRLDR